MKLLGDLRHLNHTIFTFCDNEFPHTLLYGSTNNSFSMNSNVPALTMKLLKSAKRFEKPLLSSESKCFIYFLFSNFISLGNCAACLQQFLIVMNMWDQVLSMFLKIISVFFLIILF